MVLRGIRGSPLAIEYHFIKKMFEDIVDLVIESDEFYIPRPLFQAN